MKSFTATWLSSTNHVRIKTCLYKSDNKMMGIYELTSSMPAQCWASGPYWRRHWWSTLYIAPGGNRGYWNSWSDGRSSRHMPQLWSRNLVMSRREQLDQMMGPASELSWGDMTCCASPDAASHPLAAPSWLAPKLQ